MLLLHDLYLPSIPTSTKWCVQLETMHVNSVILHGRMVFNQWAFFFKILKISISQLQINRTNAQHTLNNHCAWYTNNMTWSFSNHEQRWCFPDILGQVKSNNHSWTREQTNKERFVTKQDTHTKKHEWGLLVQFKGLLVLPLATTTTNKKTSMMWLPSICFLSFVNDCISRSADI